MRWFALLLLLCPVGMEAQRRPSRPKPATAPASAAWPIESIAIEGNHEYTREQIIAVTGLKLGQVVTPKDIDAGRQRLLDSGAFQSVGWKFAPAPGGKGYALSFEVVEATPLLPIRFEDLPAPPEEMKAALGRADPLFGARIPGTQPVLDRYTKALQDFLATKNYKDPIAAKVAPDDAGQLAVVFRPAAGLPSVARVRFTGNQVVASSALENAINAVAIGMPYKEQRFRQLLDNNVRPIYEARGRVRVAFPEIHVEAEKQDVKGLVVTVKVVEGESYSLGTVQADGAPVDSAELLKASELRKGDVFNIDRVHAGISRMERRVRRDGYMHVTSKVDRAYDDAAKVVNLKVHLQPGDRYTFGKLDIQGLDIITEPAIRKMWSMKEGQAFNADYPDYFLSQIREDGILDNLGDTKAVVKTDEAAHTVDVTLLFRGVPPKPKERRGPNG